MVMHIAGFVCPTTLDGDPLVDQGKGRQKSLPSVAYIWWLKYYRNGKPYRESSRSEKETDARRLLKKREREMAAGKIPRIYFDRVRFDEFADKWISNYRVNQKKAFSAAENSMRQLREYFGGLRVTQITLLIESYIEY
jgi:hypothetical protein